MCVGAAACEEELAEPMCIDGIAACIAACACVAFRAVAPGLDAGDAECCTATSAYLDRDSDWVVDRVGTRAVARAVAVVAAADRDGDLLEAVVDIDIDCDWRPNCTGACDGGRATVGVAAAALEMGAATVPLDRARRAVCAGACAAVEPLICVCARVCVLCWGGWPRP